MGTLARIHLVAWSLLGSLGCIGVEPTVTEPALVRLNRPPVLQVSANRELGRVIQSLQAAGLEVAGEREPNYVLRAELGRSKGSGDCGAFRNVIYTLYDLDAGEIAQLLELGIDLDDLPNGRLELLEIRGRGYTGACQPNILDDMSLKLAMQFEPEPL